MADLLKASGWARQRGAKNLFYAPTPAGEVARNTFFGIPDAVAEAAQTVGDFSTVATLEVEEPPAEAPARRGGGGVPRGTRRFVVRIDDDEFIVGSAAEAQAIVDQAVVLAQESARATAEHLAQRDTVRMRAAKRAAPVVRIESPEPVVDVPAVNAQIQTMYVDALRTVLIAQEIQARIELDEEESLAVLLL